MSRPRLPTASPVATAAAEAAGERGRSVQSGRKEFQLEHSRIRTAVIVLGSLCSIGALQKHASGECPELDRVEYSELQPTVIQEHISLVLLTGADLDQAVVGLEPQRSLHGTAAFFLREPDTSKPGPWSTTLYVRGNIARPVAFSMTIRDHTNGGVRARWLNEQLLFVQFWRGRIASADLILDVDSKRFVHQAAADYSILSEPCNMRRRR